MAPGAGARQAAAPAPRSSSAVNAIGRGAAAARPLCAAVALSALVFGVAFFAVVGSTTAFVRFNYPPAAWPTAIAALTIAFGIGQTLGPVVTGAITDALGSLSYALDAGAAMLASARGGGVSEEIEFVGWEAKRAHLRVNDHGGHGKFASPPYAYSAPAERIVALVFPVAALVVVGDFHRQHVFRVLEAELGRHPDLHRVAIGPRQDLVGEFERHLGLRMQRGRHVERRVVAVLVGALEPDIFRAACRRRPA